MQNKEILIVKNYSKTASKWVLENPILTILFLFLLGTFHGRWSVFFFFLSFLLLPTNPQILVNFLWLVVGGQIHAPVAHG